MTTEVRARAGVGAVDQSDNDHVSAVHSTAWTRWRAWLRSDVGANLLETALAILLIGVVAIAAIAYFGSNTGELWDQVPASFQQDGGPGGGRPGGGPHGGGSPPGGGGGGGPLCPPGSTDPVCTVP